MFHIILYLIAHTIVKISPTVVWLDDKFGGVEDGEPVDDVRANGGVDVVRLVLAHAGTVPGPIGEI